MTIQRTLLLAICLLVFGCSPSRFHSSDSVLIQNLRDQHALFDQLLSMTQQDSGLERVDYNWVLPDPPPISADRLSEYRRLLKTVGCGRGFTHFQAKNGITFIASAAGMATGGSSKGYYYSDVTPSPLADSLDEYLSKRQGAYIVYRHIEGNWYLYYDFDD